MPVMAADSTGLQSPVPSVADSATCYSVDTALPSGAYIRASMSSYAFPLIKPDDLIAAIVYKPANDTVKTISQIDTLIQTVEKKPFVSPWIAGVIRFCAGIIATALSFR